MTDETPPALDTEWLASKLVDRSAHGIAARITQLVSSGEIAPGARLPAVRDFAALIGVSPGTVSAAWGVLRRQRLIEGQGRQGAWVAGVLRARGPRRFENVTQYWATDVLDLSFASPDPQLLPDLRTALASAPEDPDVNSYRREPITPALRSAVEPEWPFPAEDWLAVSGGYEGLRLVFTSLVMPEDPVAVGDPSAPRIIDILDDLGARIVPVATDAEGPLPQSLAAALRRHPVLFVYEPRASSRLGASLTPARRDQLADVLAPATTLILEDDGFGSLGERPLVSVGERFPERTVLVRSYSKTHGPDLRTAVMGGRAELVLRARALMQFGAGWVSRHLQNALAHMLTAPQYVAAVESARATYRARRERLVALIRDGGAEVIGHDALNIAVRVRSEQQALLVLASRGIAADPGSAAQIVQHTPPFIRIGVGLPIPSETEVAEAIALASKAE